MEIEKLECRVCGAPIERVPEAERPYVIGEYRHMFVAAVTPAVKLTARGMAAAHRPHAPKPTEVR